MKLNSETGIAARVFAGLGTLVLLMIAILVTAFLSLHDMQKSQHQIVEENFGNLYDLPALRSNINAQRLAIAVLLETPRDKWGPWLDELDRRRNAADSIVNRLILGLRNVRSESEKLGAFIAARDAYQRVQEVQKELLLSDGKIEEAKALFLGTEMENYLSMRAIMAELERMELDEAHAIVRESEATAATVTREFLIMGIFGIVIAAGLALYVNRTIDGYVHGIDTAQAASSRANRSLRMINACNAVVIRATNEIQLLEDVCSSIVELGGYKMAWVGYADDDKNKSVRPMAYAGEDGDYIAHANISWGDNERGRGPTGTCIRTGNVVLAKDTFTEPGYDPWRYRANEKGYRSSATLPLSDGRRVYGALMVYSGIADAFDDNEVELLEELASDLAYATVALRDQSARQQAERKLRESASYSRSLLEASVDPLISVSASGRIMDVNAAMERVTGKCRSELIGGDFADCFTDPDNARACHKDALSGNAVRDRRLAIKHKSGTVVEVSYNASVFRNDAGELQGVFAAAREVLNDP